MFYLLVLFNCFKSEPDLRNLLSESLEENLAFGAVPNLSFKNVDFYTNTLTYKVKFGTISSSMRTMQSDGDILSGNGITFKRSRRPVYIDIILPQNKSNTCGLIIGSGRDGDGFIKNVKLFWRKSSNSWNIIANPTNGDLIFNVNFKWDSEYKVVLIDQVPAASVNTESMECSSLHAESEIQIEKLNKIDRLIPKNDDCTDSGNSLDVVDRLKNFIESKEGINNSSFTENTSLKEEIIQYKQQIKDKESIINEKNDEIEYCKEELKGKDGKIQNLKGQIKDKTDELASKDEKYENTLKLLKSAKEELVAKEEHLAKLMEDNKKLEAKQSPTEKKTEPSNPEMKRTLEDKIQRITELEAKIDNLQSKESENSENMGKIQELENKIRQLHTQNELDNDENYKQLLESLKTKRAELRERDRVITELESHNSDLEHKNRKSERELRVTKKKVEEMSSDLKECESQKEDIEKKLKILKKDFKEYKSQCQNEDDLVKYVDEIKNFKESLKSKENSIKDKDKIIDDYKLELKDLQEKLADKIKTSEEEIGKRNIEMEKQNTTIEDLKRQIEALKAEAEKKQQAIVSMREKIKSKNEGAIDPSELRRLQNQMKGKDMEIEQLHSKVENLNKAFEEKCDEYDLSKKKILQLESEITNMKKLNFGKQKPEGSKQPTSPFPAWWSNHTNK